MAMDVFGKHPINKDGEYFGRAVWSWRPLWQLCSDLVPELAGKVKYGHSNDGDGLDAEDSAALAKLLDAMCDDGRVAQYVAERDARLATMPDESCYICGGTGQRLEPPNVGAGELPCNGCDTTGRVRPLDAQYHVSAADVREFARFLANCGGFEIH
jgi:hypothetical protein